MLAFCLYFCVIVHLCTWNTEDRLHVRVLCRGPVCPMHTSTLIAVSILETQALPGCPASSHSNWECRKGVRAQPSSFGVLWHPLPRCDPWQPGVQHEWAYRQSERVRSLCCNAYKFCCRMRHGWHCWKWLVLVVDQSEMQVVGSLSFVLMANCFGVVGELF